MKTVPVKLRNNGYKIRIGAGTMAKLGGAVRSLKIGTDAVVITSPVIRRLHGRKVVSSLKKAGMSVKVLEVPDGERSKSAKYAFRLMEEVARYDVKRRLFIVALGGGVIGDLAGYVAAAYKRGIPYVQVPTTLLAQIDSAIGGKVAIDLPVGKNLVGAFYQPKLVWSDTNVLSTLKRRQVRNGLAEAIKYGIIADKNLFEFIGQNFEGLLKCQPKPLTEVVVRCSEIKAHIVNRDERETKGIRTILNFGHTAGHAVEAAGKFKAYHHGEAVAVGMAVAADISRRMKLLSAKDVTAIRGLIAAVGLPIRIEKLKIKDILEAMQHDKKFQGKTNRFVLATRIGSVKVVEKVPSGVIRQAVKAAMSQR